MARYGGAESVHPYGVILGGPVLAGRCGGPIDNCHTPSGSIFEGGGAGAYGVLWVAIGGCYLPTRIEHMFD